MGKSEQPAFPPPEVMRALLHPIMQMQEEPAVFADYRRFYGIGFAGAASHGGLLQVLDYQLVAQLWQPAAPSEQHGQHDLHESRGTLLCLHGYYDHLGLYRHLTGWALAQGLAVFSCDLPGHGLSSGTRADIGDFDEYQAVLTELLEQAAQLGLPRPWHLLGHSTGGGIVLDYLLRGTVREEIGHIILLAPLIRPRAWFWSTLAWRLLSPFTASIKRRFTDNSNDAQFLAFVRRDPLQAHCVPCRWFAALRRWIAQIETAAPSDHPVLLVQGQADRTLDWRHNLKILAEKLPYAQRLLLPGAKHHLVNESAPLRQQYLAFLGKHLAQGVS